MVDLRKCKKGDILISSQGSKLEYIQPTPMGYIRYLDHVVRYIEDKDGKPYNEKCYGTRTNDGFVFLKNRVPETDHDIVEIIQNPLNSKEELSIEIEEYLNAKKPIVVFSTIERGYCEWVIAKKEDDSFWLETFETKKELYEFLDKKGY